MNSRTWTIAGGVAALLLVVGVYVMSVREPSGSPETPRPAPITARPRPTGDADRLPGLGDELEVHEDHEPAAAAPAEEEGERRSSAQNIPPSTRPFESPAAASAFVEERVLELFAAVSPEMNPRSITKTCEPDGRICRFEGPWPGNDFLKNWIRAISAGKTGPEALDGVKFSEFRPYGEDGEKRFVLVAHAP